MCQTIITPNVTNPLRELSTRNSSNSSNQCRDSQCILFINKCNLMNPAILISNNNHLLNSWLDIVALHTRTSHICLISHKSMTYLELTRIFKEDHSKDKISNRVSAIITYSKDLK